MVNFKKAGVALIAGGLFARGPIFAGQPAFEQAVSLAVAGHSGAPQPVPASSAAKELTVLVYKNAKNDLDAFALLDMNEMEEAGSGNEVNVVVEFGRIPREERTGRAEDWTGVRRYYIRKDGDPEHIMSPVVWETGHADMGDWRHLAEFVLWGKANYPAKRYMLVIWNHGNGWKKGLKPAAFSRGISYDDETDNHITTPELRLALEKAGPLDLLALDACLMQTAEVAYEVRKQVPVLVASEETEPGEGYPYNVVLAALNGNPAMGVETIARLIVGAYRKAGEAAYMNTTQSAVRTAATGRLLGLLGEWARFARQEADQFVIKYAMQKAQAFYDPDLKDISDFMKVTASLPVSRALKEKSEEIVKYVSSSVVIANGISGYQHLNARGQSVYIPFKGMYNTDYDELAWAADGEWDEFIRGKQENPVTGRFYGEKNQRGRF